VNDEPWTVMRVLNWTSDYFGKKGIESARLEAELLLAHSLKMKRLDLYTHFDLVLTAQQLASFRALIQERLAGKPTSYILGHKEFMSLDFLVNEYVLIPRPETEILVEAAIEKLSEIEGEPLALDICTGCGNIACSIATYVPTARLFATESSAEAALLARKNAERLGVSEQVKIVEGDLFSPLEGKLPRQADLVVSNPPYISAGQFEKLPREVRDYEPRSALLSGPKGTEFHQRIAKEGLEFLKPGGYIAMEISPEQAEQVREILSALGEYRDAELRRDYARKERVILAQRK